MADALRWIGFAGGVLLILATWSSIITTIILPRLVSSAIVRATWLAIRGAFMAVSDRLSHYDRKDRLLALLGPIVLLAALATWMVLFLCGYALIIWPFIRGGITDALRLSGSSFFTLGVASVSQPSSTVVEFLAAASGMIVVALQIGYLPTIYGAYNRREVLVTALATRAGQPAWGPEVLARHHLVGGISTLPALFAAWESWAADITESHASYPFLLLFRSPDPLNSWVVSLLAVLDAAALCVSCLPSWTPPEARQCLQAGAAAFVSLARIVRAPGHQVIESDPHGDPAHQVQLTYDRFVYGLKHLREAGIVLERTDEEAWRAFCSWRATYAAPAVQLADFVVAVPAPWSGPRQHMTRQEVFEVLANRPLYRTPDDVVREAAVSADDASRESV